MKLSPNEETYELVFVEDDRAPDAREYFEKEFLEKTGSTLEDFLKTAENHDKDDMLIRKGGYLMLVNECGEGWQVFYKKKQVPPTMQDIFDILAGERKYQEDMKQDSDSHVVEDFPLGSGITAMNRLMRQAEDLWYLEQAPYPETMNILRKIGGIVVQMGEKYGMPKRNQDG